jgi:PAS domain S-box-containing protein
MNMQPLRLLRLLRDAPIERKLTIITMLSSTMALLLACLAFTAYELVVFRRDIVTNLASAADMVGDNSSAAIAFHDPDSARRTLQSFNDNPHIIAATIYDTDGKAFATYARADHARSFAPPAIQADGDRFGVDVEVFRGIDLAGERAGTVYIRADLDEMRARLQRYLFIVVLVMSVASLLAFFLSRRLHATISGPISALASVVGVVGRDKNYSIRASKQSDDELGQLIDGFNEMLSQIQTRDVALADAQRSLEQRVEERTGELKLEVVERRRAEDALRRQEERTRLIVDKAFDAIVSADADGNIIEWNTQAENIFGWSRREAVGRNLADMILPPRYRDAHRIGIAQLVADAEGAAINKRVEIYGVGKDEREIPIELAVTPIRVGDSYIFNAFLRDMTERKKAEVDLADAHKQLLDISRQAGMAEVATSVLHNVGNVLNSVNVSASLIAEHVRQSKTSGLTRVASLLREHEHDLGTFITADARGKHLVPHLINLSEHLRAEQAAVASEVESLHANIEHIKDIVTMQQGYAKVSGVKEVVNVVDLVEDSLRLNSGALVRHGVDVVRQFQDEPAINIDKHKVLQILVNLIRNAKYACDDSGRTDKRVTLRITSTQACVRISVADNGIGIAPENLTRIFSHGFTTRKEGHGFGLHSGALAARELGGSLTVHSDGVGHGAAFIIELPLESTAEVAACA